MESGIIRLFVIEDHPVIVAGLKNQFRPKRDSIEVIGQASSVNEAIGAADPETFDVFILDLWLDHDKPEDGIARLRKAFQGKPIIIYTSETAIPWQKRMMQAGASAYVIKTAKRLEIKSAIIQVAEGMMVMPKALIYNDQRKMSFGVNHNGQRLTPNQMNIMKQVAAGLTIREIAIKNCTTESTVEKTLTLVRTMFNAKNTAELIGILKDGNIL